jgi:nitrite reductase/ring-hydroxylating ferredoxin subunit
LTVELDIDFEGYVKLTEVEQVSLGEMIQVNLVWKGLEEEIALANTGDQIYAFRDICPHMNYPLSIGTLQGTRLECRGHGWLFELKDGKAIMPPIRKTLDRYQVKVVDGAIWVKLD